MAIVARDYVTALALVMFVAFIFMVIFTRAVYWCPVCRKFWEAGKGTVAASSAKDDYAGERKCETCRAAHDQV